MTAVSEFIHGEPDIETLTKKSASWKATHLRESQYCLQIVKCKNEACCTPFRSSIRTVLKDRFLPPPIPVVQGEDGIEWAKKVQGATYLRLFQALTLSESLISKRATRKFPKGIPFDYSCPSVHQDQVTKRMCTKCGLYLDVVTMASPTTSTVVSVPREKVRPVRIAARRGRELMCVMEIQESEWQDIDDVDTSDIDIPEEIFPASGTPTIDIANVEPIWCDEEGNY